MADYAVELREVSKRFPGPSGEVVTAVKNVTMQIKDGEFFSMLGPSGCGKTTSLRMIAGFDLTSEGEVVIHGAAHMLNMESPEEFNRIVLEFLDTVMPAA